MWTSTFDERYGSGWVQWCQGECFACDEHEPKWHTWLLDPHPAIRLIQIDSYDDLAALVAAYPQHETTADRGYGDRTETRPAWHEIAADFDGVNLTDKGQWETRLSSPLDLYGWDCESTLWLRWAFVSVEDGGTRTFEDKPWDDEDGHA